MRCKRSLVTCAVTILQSHDPAAEERDGKAECINDEHLAALHVLEVGGALRDEKIDDGN